ncbi:hypothetical protein LTR70_008383 [Exophiala xenobiotica]|uniref:Uncharacterized protein n=1 Tax=Lithohypha guttulata TaxID=1690604 RepID=A0ABR0K1Y0_9EURO|nr:hypothetical protein LTR24_007995 [Lithohypha guttulata]KAK5312124.1 hypothetical protein LTR70_008383 [Exophiala xenobiotica]
MPTTRSATKQNSTNKSKPASKKQAAKATKHEDATAESNQPSEKETPKANKANSASKPTTPLERGKAKLERNRGATKSQAPTPNSSAKRKAPTADDNTTIQNARKKAKSTGKATKQAHFSRDSTTDLEKPIMINRSPVLQLWGAVVAQFLHPDEPWSTCLSIGGSIAQLCAISKGRAIGQVAPKDESADAEGKRKKGKQESKKESRVIEVMGFPQQIQDAVVMMDGKPKPLKEELLQGKFGGASNYEKAMKAMEDGLQSWTGDKDELDGKAFHMYEKFRPDVAAGGAGWGRKGELNLHKVKSTIER